MRDRKIVKAGFVAVILFVCMAFEPVAAQENIRDTVVCEEDTTVYEIVEQFPEFSGGGEAARIKFIENNIQYPQVHVSIEGTVLVSVIVEKDGSLSHFEVKRGIAAVLDDEALRVVKLMPKWIQGKQDGKAVRVRWLIPVKFMLF